MIKYATQLQGHVNGYVRYIAEQVLNQPTWSRRESCVLIIDVQLLSGYQYAEIRVDGRNSASYYTDLNGHAEIDVSHIVRQTTASSYTFEVVTYQGEEDGYADVTIQLKDGLSFENCTMPRSMYEAALGVERAILPPSVIYNYPAAAAQYAHDYPLMVDAICPTRRVFQALLTQDDGSGLQTRSILDQSLSLKLESTTGRRITRINGWYTQGSAAIWQLTELQDCEQYAIVEWVAQTGARRRAIWKPISKTWSSTNVVELQSNYNSVRQLKGSALNVKLRIENCDPYDVAYYSDAALASELYVALNVDELSLLGDEYTRAAVTGTNYTIPVGGRQNVELTIALKRYEN